MLTDFIEELNTFIKTSQFYLITWLYCFTGLWGFNIVNWVLGSPLNILGIYPRHIFGLLGIIFSPILHKNFSHLFFNSTPLFALGLAILARGLPIFLEVTGVVVVLGGFGVWLFARRALHIGASGLVSGYFGYILATAYFDPSATALLLALVVAYYFGSIFLGIFPQEDKISWESHLFGFLAGVASAFHLIPLAFWQKFVLLLY
ncbi:MAG TPA: rhomboid family intramembrane serine protease [Gammaproteobacteria bacterium]|nr:rhomboid family intramembrane serine protease [Gammaproteobacteria bacterium]